jgi:alpha-glucosidase
VHVLDHEVSWDKHDGIKSAVTGLLSSGLSGYAFEHSDIGGYTAIDSPLLEYHRSKELLMRWIELGAFTVVFRTHEGNRPGVNHQIYSDEETLRHFDRLAEVYAAWKPYRTKLVEEVAGTVSPSSGTRSPLPRRPGGVRPRVPVHGWGGAHGGARPRPRRRGRGGLPTGRWVHLWSDKEYGSLEGGVYETVPAPVGEPAFFCKEGSEAGPHMTVELEERGLLERFSR